MTLRGSVAAVPRGLLATEVASQRERRLAWTVVGVSLLAFVAGAPFVRLPMPRVPAFIPAYEAALWVTDCITAILLFNQFARLRTTAMLLLASGYLFDALMVIPHGLAFPGVFAPTGLLGAGSQTTAWLYVFWHTGFPLFVLAYALLSDRRTEAVFVQTGPAIVVAAAGVFVLVAALTMLTTLGHDLLPPIIVGGDYSRLVTSGISPAMWLLTALALLVLWRRNRLTVLNLWLMVVLLAWLLDIGYSAVIGSHRFDLGWYAGRAYGLMAASFVLGALLVEMNQLYGILADALALAESRNADLISSREAFARVQRFEAIGELVGGVAHDFNNILTVVGGTLEYVLAGSGLDARTRRSLEASLQAADRGGRITKHLLSFARRQVLRPEIVDVNALIANLEAFITHAVGPGVRIVSAFGAGLWPIQVDRAEFETALVNLLVNARDAMQGRGQVVIETQAMTLMPENAAGLPVGDYAMIAVGDTGPGMTPEVAARAFDPFFTTKEVGKGTGLGLSQVYGFVRSAGGHVRIVSAPGQGARIEMLIPRAAAAPAPLPPTPPPPAIRHAAAGTVLVVEDDPAVRDMTVLGLAELGYRVRSAGDARTALAMLGDDPDIELLFTDVVMPGGMSGAQLAAEARRMRPGLKVLLTSGHAAAALAERHGLSDDFEVLAKPYKREELASKLRLVSGAPPAA